MNDEEYRRHEWAKREAKIEEEEKIIEICERSKKILEGCSNHGCILKKHTGMATNGPCHCLDRINETVYEFIKNNRKTLAYVFMNKVFYQIAETGRYKK